MLGSAGRPKTTHPTAVRVWSSSKADPTKQDMLVCPSAASWATRRSVAISPPVDAGRPLTRASSAAARADHNGAERELVPSVRGLVLADYPVDAAVGDDPHDRHADEARQGNPNSDMPAPVDR